MGRCEECGGDHRQYTWECTREDGKSVEFDILSNGDSSVNGYLGCQGVSIETLAVMGAGGVQMAVAMDLSCTTDDDADGIPIGFAMSVDGAKGFADMLYRAAEQADRGETVRVEPPSAR